MFVKKKLSECSRCTTAWQVMVENELVINFAILKEESGKLNWKKNKKSHENCLFIDIEFFLIYILHLWKHIQRVYNNIK